MWILLGILLVVGWMMLKLFVGVASFAVHLLLVSRNLERIARSKATLQPFAARTDRS